MTAAAHSSEAATRRGQEIARTARALLVAVAAVAALVTPAPPGGASGFGPTAAGPTAARPAAVSAGGYVPVAPERILDTRFGLGATAAPVGPRQTITVTVAGRGGVPASGAGAAVLNVTGVTPSAPTFVTVWPGGEAQPLASNLNLGTNQVRPNLVIVKLGPAGEINLFNAEGAIHLVADVMGWFPAVPGAGYQGVNPARILDTRDGTGGRLGALGDRGALDVVVTGRGGVPATGVGAVVLNVTGIALGPGTFLTAWPAGEPLPEASNLNVDPGDTRPNLVVAKVGAGGRVSIFNAVGPTEVIADVMGWFPAASGFTPLTPARILDTRSGNGTGQAGPVGARQTITVPVAGRGGVPASGVGAVVVNVTATEPSGNGFVTAFPSSLYRPCTSTLNVEPGSTAPNLAVVAVSPETGSIQLYNADGASHLIADVLGWFPAASTPPRGGEWCGDPYRIYLDGTGGPLADHAVAAASQSDDLRTLAYVSSHPGIVAGDGNGVDDVFAVSAGDPARHRRVSLSGAGAEANASSRQAVLAGSGRFVAFTSLASNLVAGDSNGVSDVFVKDLATGAISRASVPSGAGGGAAGEGNGASTNPALSADGRSVVFRSAATNLDPADTDPGLDLFVRDLQAGTTRRVSVTAGGAGHGEGFVSAPALAAGGSTVVFATAGALVAGDTNGTADVYALNLADLSLTRLTTGSAGTGTGTASADVDLAVRPDGSRVAFVSRLDGMVPANPSGRDDAFVWDRAGAALRLVPAGPGHPVEVAVAAAADVVAVAYAPSPGTPATAIHTIDLSTGQRGVSSPVPAGSSCSFSDLSLNASGDVTTSLRFCHPAANPTQQLTDLIRWHG